MNRHHVKKRMAKRMAKRREFFDFCDNADELQLGISRLCSAAKIASASMAQVSKNIQAIKWPKVSVVIPNMKINES